MLNYNVALVFDKDFQNRIIDYSIKINSKLKTIFSLVKNEVPHITVVKFDSKKELSNSTIDKIKRLSESELHINFGGLTLLPSKTTGVWLEISVLKSGELSILQNEIINVLKSEDIEIINKTNDYYRPHITLCKIEKTNLLNIENLEPDIVRTKNLRVKAVLGFSGSDFEFYPIEK